MHCGQDGGLNETVRNIATWKWYVVGQVSSPVVHEHVIPVSPETTPVVIATCRLVDGEVDQTGQLAGHQRGRPMTRVDSDDMKTNALTADDVVRQSNTQIIQPFGLLSTVRCVGLDQ